MTLLSGSFGDPYVVAWIGLAIVLIYFVSMTVAFHGGPSRTVGVTRYDPPEGASPGLAAYLRERGRSERAFAATLISLASKGYLRIQQEKDWFVLEKLREADASLPIEESTIFGVLLPTSLKYTFNGAECARVSSAFRAFDKTMHTLAEPDLISSHMTAWLIGVAYSMVTILWVVTSSSVLRNGTPLRSIVAVSFIILLGGFCLVAALRAWPALIRKLASLLPGVHHPKLPLSLNDAIPIYLTVSALVGFGFLASLTSNSFALQLAAVVFLDTVFHHLLVAPTRAGHEMLEELNGFREFLARADADRLNRENQAGQTPKVLEKYSAYSVALDVEHGWGEGLTDNLIELLQMDQAYSLRPPKLPTSFGGDDAPIELDIDSRK